MTSADSRKTNFGENVHKKYDFHARLMSDQEYFRGKERILWEVKEILLKNRKNEDEISMVDKSISENDVELRKTNIAIAEFEDVHCKQQELFTNSDAMKGMMLSANYEMISWIIEGYALNPECREKSELGNCLVTLMCQPSCCKISMDQKKVVSKISRAISDELRHALFQDGLQNQHGFSEYVEFLALSFIYGRNVSRTTEAHNYSRYDTIMQIAMHFLDGVEQINLKSVSTPRSSGGKSINEKFCSTATATSSKERVGQLHEANSMRNQLCPSVEAFSPYRDLSSRPHFQFGKVGKFPCFTMEGNKSYSLVEAIDNLQRKLERLDERTFSGLPFYISLAITPGDAQFMLSEYGRPIRKLGESHTISNYRGATEFLLAFLNLIPIFNEFQKILDARQPAWNVDITASSGVATPISEKIYIDSKECVHHIYFQKQINATNWGVSSWEDLLHIYTNLAEKPVPDSLATPMKGQNLAEIFTCGAKTFTLRLLPVAFPGGAETFLTSYRLVAQCFYDILSALMWLHTYDIVHRDVVGRNILKRICKKGFILTDFEHSARSGEKFSKDDRNDDELPIRSTESGFADADKWFPRDDIEQLRKFLQLAIGTVSFSHQSLHMFETLFNPVAVDSAYKKLINIDYQANTTMACSEILHEIDICFKKYKSPFEEDCFGGHAP